MRKIKKLSLELANQIAAGEVIERPAAVVKELVENSIDAGASLIHITIVNSGVGLIKVMDNGSGIAKDELLLAVVPHATSKLYSQEELLTINSLGFRGEALASISAVSRFKLISRAADLNDAWSLENNNLLPSSHPIGTTVEVSDLFFNIKARRYFLKSKRTETLHIEEIVKRLILSNFNIAFKFVVDNKIIFNLPLANSKLLQQERISKVLGKNFIANAHYISCHNDSMSLTGWVGNAAYHTSQNNEQFIFLNGRAIKDKVLLHAVKSCYSKFLPEGRSAAFILYLAINPQEVDVNVHPTKSEVRFRKMRLVYDFVNRGVGGVVGVAVIESASSVIASERSERSNPEQEVDPGQACEAPIRHPGQACEASAAAGIHLIKLFFNRYALIEKDHDYFIVDLKKNYLKLNSKLSWERLVATITAGEIVNLINSAGPDCYKKITEDFLNF